MTDDAVTVEVPDAPRTNWADVAERARAASARLDSDLEALAAQAFVDHQDAEAMRTAILDTLAIYADLELQALGCMDKARAAAAHRAWARQERWEETARDLRARSAELMANRLKALHRVPVESREMTDDEMREAGMV